MCQLNCHIWAIYYDEILNTELTLNQILSSNFQEVEGVFSHIPYAEDFVNQD